MGTLIKQELFKLTHKKRYLAGSVIYGRGANRLCGVVLALS